jgi:hypothetical protein
VEVQQLNIAIPTAKDAIKTAIKITGMIITTTYFLFDFIISQF